ncbi:hypothetical protein MMC14_003354 [Varicellaria rhodocarpa]|nr:hypothetical protein [Varicellaria rhodocarpa]
MLPLLCKVTRQGLRSNIGTGESDEDSIKDSEGRESEGKGNYWLALKEIRSNGGEGGKGQDDGENVGEEGCWEGKLGGMNGGVYGEASQGGAELDK